MTPLAASRRARLASLVMSLLALPSAAWAQNAEQTVERTAPSCADAQARCATACPSGTRLAATQCSRSGSAPAQVRCRCAPTSGAAPAPPPAPTPPTAPARTPAPTPATSFPALRNPTDLTCGNPSIAPTPTRIPPAERAAMLALHNTARQRVGNAPLAWDDTLAAYAQGWVDALATNNQRVAAGLPSAIPGSMGVHSNGSCYAEANGRYPENITSGNAAASQSVQLWVDEERNYDTAAHRCNSRGECGHWLSLVGSTVTRVGCGWNASSSWACAYDRFGAIRTPDGSYVEPYARNLPNLVAGRHYVLNGNCVTVGSIDGAMVRWSRTTANGSSSGTAIITSFGAACAP